MTNETKYQWSVNREVLGDELYPPSFSIKESNQIIEDYVNCIKEYEKTRGTKIEYKTILKRRRITKVKIKSLDNLINGEISYDRGMKYALHGGSRGVPQDTHERIRLLIYFNSNNKEDIKERKELLKFLKK